MSKTKRYSLADLEIPDLEKIPEAVRKGAVRESVKLVAKDARRLAPQGRDRRKAAKKTLRRSIRYSVRKRGLEGAVRAVAPHAHLVHDGTRPHWIRARKGTSGGGFYARMHLGVMTFRAGSRLVYARAVFHPGARPNPFLNKALAQNVGEIERILAQTAEQGIEEALT